MKIQLFDELRLALYSPWGIDIVVWDGKTGLTTMGKGTEVQGHSIIFHGPRKWLDASVALEVILNDKLEGLAYPDR